MSLIEEIRDAAVDGTIDLGTILRKCKVLAAQLSSHPLEDWVIWESNGYPAGIEVPDYRKWSLEIRGNFLSATHQWTDTPVPTVLIPNEHRHLFESYQCRSSINNIEEMLSDKDSTEYGVQFDNLPILVGMSEAVTGHCTSARAYFSRTNFIEIVNTVRNRVLDFSLALAGMHPEIAEVGSSKGEIIETSVINQIFNTTVIDGSANIVGSSTGSNIIGRVESGNFESLRSQLLESGLSAPDLEELGSAIAADDTPSPDKPFGPKVSEWITKMVGKAGQGTWNISVSTAQALLAGALKKYFGL